MHDSFNRQAPSPHPEIMASVRPTHRSDRSQASAALQLCGIILLDSDRRSIADAVVIPFRDLGALVRSVPYASMDVSPPGVAAYRAVVEGAFAGGPVVPAPYGTVFKTRDSLLRWLELHYFTLEDAARFLEHRAMARIRVTPGLATADWDTREMRVRDHDIEVTAFDSFRVLRKHAVAFVAVAPDGGRPTQVGAEAAYLVDRDQWSSFSNDVKEEQRRLPDLRIEQTGPWPAYDFVTLDFNG